MNREINSRAVDIRWRFIAPLDNSNLQRAMTRVDFNNSNSRAYRGLIILIISSILVGKSRILHSYTCRTGIVRYISDVGIKK